MSQKTRVLFLNLAALGLGLSIFHYFQSDGLTFQCTIGEVSPLCLVRKYFQAAGFAYHFFEILAALPLIALIFHRGPRASLFTMLWGLFLMPMLGRTCADLSFLFGMIFFIRAQKIQNVCQDRACQNEA